MALSNGNSSGKLPMIPSAHFSLVPSDVSFVFDSADRLTRARAAWCGGVNLVVASQVFTAEKSSVLSGVCVPHILISETVVLKFSKRMVDVALVVSGRCDVSSEGDDLNTQTSKNPKVKK